MPHRREPHNRLDAARAGSDGTLRQHAQGADLTGAAGVDAAAEFEALAADAHGAHGLAVLLIEQRDRAGFPGFVEVHELHIHRQILEDPAVHLLLDLHQRVTVDRLVVGEVETQPLRANQRARLLHVPADDLPKRRVQQVGRSVMPPGRVAPVAVHGGSHRVAGVHCALNEPSRVRDSLAQRLRVAHLEAEPLAADDALVADLPAALRVERGPVQHQRALSAL